MVQEGLQNIIKHAGATTFSIRGTVKGSQLTCTIADNGTGMPKSYTRGTGLKNIERRVTTIKGKYRLQNAAPQGTALVITLTDGPDPKVAQRLLH